MKVLFVNTNCGSGSTGRIVTDLYSMLLSKGHSAKIAYAHGEATKAKPEDCVKLQGKVRYYIHNALSRLSDRAGFYSTKATNRLISLIDSYNPDIIHLHNLHGYYLNISVLFDYLSQKDIPIVWTLHDCWAITGHCVHFSYQGCMKWKTKCYECPQKCTYPKSYFRDQSLRNYLEKKQLFTSIKRMHITTPSNWLKSVVCDSFLGLYPVTTIYNGIDLTIFKKTDSYVRDNLGISKEKKMILCVAYIWDAKKGLEDIIELNRRIDHNKFQIVIVGLTREQIYNLPSPIIGIERTSSLEELVELYSAADVFVNPSYEETMGMVTAEALACGTPAVVYNKTAVPEVVNSDSGTIVEAGDIDSLFDKLVNLPVFDSDRVKMRAEEFEKNKQYNLYYNLYESILEI